MVAKTRFWLDVFIFTGFLVALEPKFTGKQLHEWLLMAGVGTLLIHFLFHWEWLIKISLNFFKNVFHISRLNYVVAIVIFIGFITIITSGLMISKSFLPYFGIKVAESRGWESIHELASNLTLVLVAFHFALHWEWVWRTFNQILTGIIRPKSAQAAGAFANPDEGLEGE
ncbi:MAG: DUF4405 domain-containing protein [Anaerolineales bacterium]|nr:DUF4405 domain-containing protein [Anaerolineales bacterium]